MADFRSDTVTQPTLGMWDAMRSAPLGDDVFGDDPTVQQIEELATKITKKPAALFCVTATMSNQLSLCTVLERGSSVLCPSNSHIYLYETGGVAHHSSAQIIPVTPEPVTWNEKVNWGSTKELEPFGPRQEITVESLKNEIREPDVHHPITKAITLENTVDGVIQSLDNMKKVHEFAENNWFSRLHLHLDGSRLWNSSQETDIPISEYCSHFDSITLCMSKGLGAPVGSLLVGEKKMIERARHLRKLFGGGWRQAGILAAAGMYGIKEVVPKMKEDHKRTRKFALELKNMGYFLEKRVDTNMVWISTVNPFNSNQTKSVNLEDLSRYMSERGILFICNSPKSARIVVHHQTKEQHIEMFLELAKKYESEKK